MEGLEFQIKMSWILRCYLLSCKYKICYTEVYFKTTLFDNKTQALYITGSASKTQVLKKNQDAIFSVQEITSADTTSKSTVNLLEKNKTNLTTNTIKL